MERAGCGSLGSWLRTKCAGTGKLSAALILQACRGGTGLATHLRGLIRLMLSQSARLSANAGLAGVSTWFPKVKRSDEAAEARRAQLPRSKWQRHLQVATVFSDVVAWCVLSRNKVWPAQATW